MPFLIDEIMLSAVRALKATLHAIIWRLHKPSQAEFPVTRLAVCRTSPRRGISFMRSLYSRKGVMIMISGSLKL
ncbi:hypothetical protein LLH03_10400, partial [bacterium]|nr:hypothetical protein [bacterium]